MTVKTNTIVEIAVTKHTIINPFVFGVIPIITVFSMVNTHIKDVFTTIRILKIWIKISQNMTNTEHILEPTIYIYRTIGSMIPFASTMKENMKQTPDNISAEEMQTFQHTHTHVQQTSQSANQTANVTQTSSKNSSKVSSCLIKTKDVLLLGLNIYDVISDILLSLEWIHGVSIFNGTCSYDYSAYGYLLLVFSCIGFLIMFVTQTIGLICGKKNDKYNSVGLCTPRSGRA
eukprot:980349_1